MRPSLALQVQGALQPPHPSNVRQDRAGNSQRIESVAQRCGHAHGSRAGDPRIFHAPKDRPRDPAPFAQRQHDACPCFAAGAEPVQENERQPAAVAALDEVERRRSNASRLGMTPDVEALPPCLGPLPGTSSRRTPSFRRADGQPETPEPCLKARDVRFRRCLAPSPPVSLCPRRDPHSRFFAFNPGNRRADRDDIAFNGQCVDDHFRRRVLEIQNPPSCPSRSRRGGRRACRPRPGLTNQVRSVPVPWFRQDAAW